MRALITKLIGRRCCDESDQAETGSQRRSQEEYLYDYRVSINSRSTGSAKASGNSVGEKCNTSAILVLSVPNHRLEQRRDKHIECCINEYGADIHELNHLNGDELRG